MNRDGHALHMKTRHFWWGLALVAASLGLGVVASSGALNGIDTALFRALAMTHATSPGWSISVAQFVTHLGDVSMRSVIVIALLCAVMVRRNWRVAVIFVVTVALSITGHALAKEAFMRARPSRVPHLDFVDSYAYPSGHAAGAMVVLLLGALLLGGRRSVIAAMLVAVAIGMSRVALAVHWPADVIGGWLFGGGTALMGYAVAQGLMPKRRA